MSNKHNNGVTSFPMRKEMYYYITLTKSIEDDTGELMVFLFAGLTNITYQTLGTSMRKKVTPIISKVIEVPYEESPLYTRVYPEGTFINELSKGEYERLLKEAKEDIYTLFKYKFDFN